MGFWITHNSFALFQSGVLAAGLLFIGFGILSEAKARRVSNLIRLTEQHRELWERMYVQPELARILDRDIDVETENVTPDEEMFVTFIILHLSSTYFAIRAGFFQKPHALRKDIEEFFSLPIPHAVWEKVKELQEPPFVRFVERCFPSIDQ